MDVTEDLVRHVAHLARLDLTEDEVREMAPQLTRILEHVEGVQRIDVGEADPSALSPIPFEALRDDEPGPTLDRRQVTRNAPRHDGAFLVVPRVLDPSADA